MGTAWIRKMEDVILWRERFAQSLAEGSGFCQEKIGILCEAMEEQDAERR